MTYTGPIDKFTPRRACSAEIARRWLASKPATTVLYFIADRESKAANCAGQLRNELGRSPGPALRPTRISASASSCDFPMYELDEEDR